MEVIEGDFREFSPFMSECSMTIGNFDGVHLGHRQLIAKMLQEGQNLGISTCLLTFSPHPSHVLGGVKVDNIYPLRSQVELMDSLGVDHLFVQDFDESFSRMTSEDFLRQYLFRLWSPKSLVVGDDFGFGQSKSGGAELLGEECRSRGCGWLQCETLNDDHGRRISSSLVREALRLGEVETFNALLGRPYFIEGPVVAGQKLGRSLGFPTANIKLEDRLYPKNGVYLGRVQSLPGAPVGVMNIGVRPSVDPSQKLSVECHILDFEGDLYGTSLNFQLEGRLRDEMRFQSKEDLVQQIQRDIAAARAVKRDPAP